MFKFIPILSFTTFLIISLFWCSNQTFASLPAPTGPECEFNGEIIKAISWSTPLNTESNDNNFILQVKIINPTKLIFENLSYQNFSCSLLKDLTINISSDTRLEAGTVQHLKKSDFFSGRTISGRIHVNLNDKGLPKDIANFTSWYSLGTSSGNEIDILGPQDVLCTPDKKECPDGSYVERAGFKCEFMSCPEIKFGFWGKILNWFKNIFN